MARMMKHCAPWRSGIPDRFMVQVAEKRPFDVASLKEYLLRSNAGVRERIIGPHISSHGPLVHAGSSDQSGFKGYDFKLHQCTDARHVTVPPQFFLKFSAIHRRTAASVVGNGRGFKDVRAGGAIIAEAHKTCGGTAAAYAFETSPKPPTGRIDMDPNILTLINHIPHNVKRLSDPSVRDRENALTQAFIIRRLLKQLHGRTDISVWPAYYSWESGYDWLGETPSERPSPEVMQKMRQAARIMTRYALAEGREFETQYAALTMLYDPYRLGRVNDPRAVFGSLGNEMFCVTADFRNVTASQTSNERLSRLSLASLFYAGFDSAGGHHGHVRGVGGSDGTHILGIMDTSREVIGRVKKHLLETFPIINQLTHGGERILSILYDRDTAEAKFV